MRTSNNNGLRALYATMTQESFLPGESEGREKMLQNPDVLFFGSGLSFLKDPDITVIDLKDAPKGHSAIAFPKDSEFTALFNYHMMKNHMSGVQDKLWTKWFGTVESGVGTSSDPEESENVTKSLGYDNVMFPVLVLVMGLVVSLSTIVLERCSIFITGRKPK